MRSPVVIDGRNLYEPEMMQKEEIVYDGLGRSNRKLNNARNASC